MEVKRSIRGNGPLMTVFGLVTVMGIMAGTSQMSSVLNSKRQVKILDSVEGFYAGEVIAIAMLENKRGASVATPSALSQVTLPPSVMRRFSGSNASWYSEVAAGNVMSHCAAVRFPGSKNDVVTCMVTSPPTADLKVNNSDIPITANYNDTVTLKWESKNASQCLVTINGGSCASPSSSCNALSHAGLTSLNLTANPSTVLLYCQGFTGGMPDSIRVTVNGVPTPTPTPIPTPPPCGGYDYAGGCWRTANAYTTCRTACAPYGGPKPVAINQAQCQTIRSALGHPVTQGVLPGGMGNNCASYVCARANTCLAWPVGGARVVCGGRTPPRPDCNTYPPGIGNYDYYYNNENGGIPSTAIMACSCQY